MLQRFLYVHINLWHLCKSKSDTFYELSKVFPGNSVNWFTLYLLDRNLLNQIGGFFKDNVISNLCVILIFCIELDTEGSNSMIQWLLSFWYIRPYRPIKMRDSFKGNIFSRNNEWLIMNDFDFFHKQSYIHCPNLQHEWMKIIIKWTSFWRNGLTCDCYYFM